MPSRLLTTILPSDEHSPSASVATKKQVLALLIFVGYGIHAFGDHPRYRPGKAAGNVKIQALLSRLVELANVRSPSPSVSFDDVNKAARRSLVKALAVIPAPDFVMSVAQLLTVQDIGVCNLLAGSSRALTRFIGPIWRSGVVRGEAAAHRSFDKSVPQSGRYWCHRNPARRFAHSGWYAEEIGSPSSQRHRVHKRTV